jgi:hypothetical protein
VADRRNSVRETQDQTAQDRQEDSGSHAWRRSQVVERASVRVYCALQAMDISLAASRGGISGVGGQSNVSSAGSPLDPAGPWSFCMAVRAEF